jgi:hypothetical protein
MMSQQVRIRLMAAATKLPKHSMATIASRLSDVASASEGDKLAEAQVNTLGQESRIL